MGGDSSPAEVDSLAAFIKIYTRGTIKTAWYSGRPRISEDCSLTNFDYIKIGPYIERFGGLNSPITNQRFYHINNGVMTDITSWFQKNKVLQESHSQSTIYR